MTSRAEGGTKEGGLEKTGRFLRNINAVGAVALGGAGVLLESTILLTLGAINAGQAIFFEAFRRWGKKRKSARGAGRMALKTA